MREILFRGKRTDNGEWVEGYYTKGFLYPDEKELNDMIYMFLGTTSEWEFDFAIVTHETIGQYTGLTDANGTKIFEGDILKHEFDEGYYDLLEVVYDEELAKFQYRDVKMKGFKFDIVVDIETVVGNIHDNPELLEGE